MRRGKPLRTYARLERRTPLPRGKGFSHTGGSSHGSRTAKSTQRVGTEAEPLVASEGQQGEVALPKFPKPAPRSHGAPAQIKHSPMRKSARGTKHSRRQRELGFMHFCHERGCELARDPEAQRILGISHDCSFDPIEFAHLHDLRRYAPGDIGAGLDRTTHLGIDGKPGGKASWYVALDRQGQHTIRMRLADRARAAWNALTDAQRADWERRAKEFLAEPGAAA